MDERGSAPKKPNLNQFSTFGIHMSIEEAKAQLEEMQRLFALKVKKKESEKKLKKVMTPDQSEWTEVHTLASKKNSKANDILLRNLKGNFEWINTQAEKLGIPPPSKLSAFGLSAAEKKRKRSSEIIKEVFVKEYIVVDGMHRNLIPPSKVEGSRGLVIRETESGIFFHNRNFDIVFQREEEFHLATTAQYWIMVVRSALNTLEIREPIRGTPIIIRIVCFTLRNVFK
nr:hypothetical protein [Tanacetum cinerariifolium]